jgi:hypothetical protein
MRRNRSVGLWVIVVVAFGAMTSGCFRLWPSWGGSWGTSSSSSSPGSTTESLSLANGYQEGDMGDVAAFSGETFVADGYSYEGYTHVRLESQGSDWWVMSLVDVTGPPLETLVPGTVYRSAQTGVIDDDDVDIDIVGCSGPTQGNWTYDTHATRSEMEVEDLGDGWRRVYFRAWYADTSSGPEQLATGSFDVRTVR